MAPTMSQSGPIEVDKEARTRVVLRGRAAAAVFSRRGGGQRALVVVVPTRSHDHSLDLLQTSANQWTRGVGRCGAVLWPAMEGSQRRRDARVKAVQWPSDRGRGKRGQVVEKRGSRRGSSGDAEPLHAATAAGLLQAATRVLHH